MRFDSYHPVINFIYFVMAIICILCFDHPAFLAISYISAFLYSVKLKGKRGFLFNMLLIAVAVLYTIIYSSYHHFGVTNIGENSIGNQITLEAVVFGGTIGIRGIAAIMMMSCIFATITSDKVVYLFGRISPKVSLFISIVLRSVPKIKERTRRICLSQEGIGRGIRRGNLFQRVKHGVRVLSIIISGTLEDFMESSVSMKSRGYTLKGRTAFSIYRFDNRDRIVVVFFALSLSVIYLAFQLCETTILYNPQIIWKHITPMSILFYLTYAIFMLMPLMLQTIGELKNRR